MSTTATIPITIEPEAQARINELGMQREFEQMLEHTLRTIPDLRAIGVTPAYDYEEGGEPRITIDAYRPDPGPGKYDPTDQQWGEWQMRAFPPEVFQHFLLMSFYEPSNGR